MRKLSRVKNAFGSTFCRNGYVAWSTVGVQVNYRPFLDVAVLYVATIQIRHYSSPGYSYRGFNNSLKTDLEAYYHDNLIHLHS